MKKGDYLAAKEEKRRPTSEAIIVLIVFIMVFIAVIFRFAIRTGTNEGFFSFMPTNKQAYKVSRVFVRPTINSTGDITFPDNDFQCSKNSDSVYVIKSFYTVMDNEGHDSRGTFAITLKFTGGSSLDSRNWKMLALQEDK